MSVRTSSLPIALDSDRSFCPNVGHTSDKEEQVRWPVKPELSNVHARQYTSGLAHFRFASYGKIALMSNISKTVTDTTMGSMEAKYETDPGPSIGTMTFDLRWPWTVLVQAHQTYRSNISTTVTDTMLRLRSRIGSLHGLSIGTMTFDHGWPWTVLDQGHRTFASDISNTTRDTMLDTMQVK